MTITSAATSQKRRLVSSAHRDRSKLTAALSSQRSRVIEGSSPAAGRPPRCRRPVAPRHLVGEDELEELGVGHAPAPGEGQALGQGVEERAELEPAQHGAQLGRDGGGGHRGISLARGAKAVSGRAKRRGSTSATGRRSDGVGLGRPLEHPPDQSDVDHVGLERPGAGGLDPRRAPYRLA